jgi:hypothetical protein
VISVLPRLGDHATGSFASLARRTVRFLHPVGVLFMLALLVAAQPAQSFALFRCVYTGTALESCCCPGADPIHDDATEKLSKTSCCSVEHIDGSLPAGATESHKLVSAALPQVRPLPALHPASEALFQTRAPIATKRLGLAEQPRAGPPLIIAHRRLLI